MLGLGIGCQGLLPEENFRAHRHGIGWYDIAIRIDVFRANERPQGVSFSQPGRRWGRGSITAFDLIGDLPPLHFIANFPVAQIFFAGIMRREVVDSAKLEPPRRRVLLRPLIQLDRG